MKTTNFTKTLFEKNWFWALLMVLNVSFMTSCSEDDEFTNPLPTPPFEEVSARYTMTHASSPYKSLEFFAGGQYLLVKNTSARAASYDNMIFGKFTKMDNDNFQLEGFGRVQLKNAGAEITFQPDGDMPQTLTAKKEVAMANDDKTNALCRTWKLVKLHERGWNKFEGEWDDVYTPDMNDPELLVNMVFSKSGTFVNTYQDGRIYAAYWRWEDKNSGVIRASTDNIWNNGNEGNVTITFSEGNKMIGREYFKDLETGEWEEIITELVDASSK